MPPKRTRPARASAATQSDLLWPWPRIWPGVGYWRYSFADASVIWSDAVYQIHGHAAR